MFEISGKSGESPSRNWPKRLVCPSGISPKSRRDLTDPSLSTLRKLSAALDIPTYLFMGGESSTSLTTRQADMLILSQPNSNVRYHLLTPMPNGNFVPQSLVIRFELEPHCKDGDLPVIHPSEEILLLEQGQLDVMVKSETTRLNAGDTTVVQSNLPHIVSNPGIPQRWGWLCSPPPFGSPTTGAVLTAVAKPESSHRLAQQRVFREGFSQTNGHGRAMPAPTRVFAA